MTRHLSVLCGGKDVIKLPLEHQALRQGPIGVLLVHKDDILQYRLRSKRTSLLKLLLSCSHRVNRKLQ